MNPDVNTHTNFNLPPPVAEISPPVTSAEGVPSLEGQVSVPENQPVAQNMQTTALPASPPLTPSAASAAQSTTSLVAGSTPATASDNDVIEKEWITKIRQVIAQTKTDPYQQNQQLAVLKADYLQKRYGKTIKLS